MNFYNISQAPERLQTAQHFHSSLQQHTVQNVEAQLYVARQRNYQLSLQYFRNKFGTGEAYTQFIETNGLQSLGAPPEPPVYDLKRELQIKARQIQQRESLKIQERKGYKDRGSKESEGKQENGFSHKSRHHKNIWVEQDHSQQQQKITETKEAPHFQINVAEAKQGAFISEFKNYLSNKKRVKEEPAEVKNRTINESVNLSQFKNTNSSFSPTKALSKSKLDNAEKSYEEELVKKIFRDILGKIDKKSRVEKIQLVEYLTNNKKVLKVLQITPEEVSKGVMSLQTKDRDMMSYNQCLLYVLQSLGKQEEAKKLKAKQQFSQIPEGCMLSKEILGVFESTFKGMDRHNDLIIRRLPFITKLATAPLIKKNLNMPAVFEPEYSRHISLRRIFERIEIQSLLCSEEEKKLNEYISWNQFTNYFESGHRQRSKYDLIVLLESLKNEDKFGLSHIPESICDMINTAVRKLDCGEELFSALEIINEIKMHREYEIEKYTFIRNLGDETNEISQTFEEALTRIKEQGQKYVSPKQFMEYFSVRGKPIEQFQLQKNNQQVRNNSAAKVSFIEQDLFEKADQPDGYDSDPEIYSNSKLFEKGKAQSRKSQANIKKYKETSQSFIRTDERINRTEKDQEFKPLKVTVPKPFSFEERQKQRKMAREQQVIAETNERRAFRAKSIPQKVAEVGLFDKMMEEQRKKNEERKRCSMIMTLANEKPFSFQSRKVDKKTKEQRQDFIFKAQPIPWYCSVDLLNKKKEGQIIRNERIAKMAQENLAKAKLPPRMEKDFLEKEARKVLQSSDRKKQAKSVAKVRDPPNFQKMHRQFEQALERKRKQNKRTQIKQFNFAPTKNNFISKTNNEIIEEQPQRQSRQQISCLKTNVDIMAQSTAKFTQQVEKRRKEQQQKRKKQLEKKREEEDRLQVDMELKQKVQEAANKNKENKERQAEWRKQQNNKQMQSFKEWKKTCIEKGRQQPLLINRVSKRDQKIEKMKRLSAISETLKKNGIRGKQHDNYFKREELLMLQDYEQLKDKL